MSTGTSVSVECGGVSNQHSYRWMCSLLRKPRDRSNVGGTTTKGWVSHYSQMNLPPVTGCGSRFCICKLSIAVNVFTSRSKLMSCDGSMQLLKWLNKYVFHVTVRNFSLSAVCITQRADVWHSFNYHFAGWWCRLCRWPSSSFSWNH